MHRSWDILLTNQNALQSLAYSVPFFHSAMLLSLQFIFPTNDHSGMKKIPQRIVTSYEISLNSPKIFRPLSIFMVFQVSLPSRQLLSLCSILLIGLVLAFIGKTHINFNSLLMLTWRFCWLSASFRRDVGKWSKLRISFETKIVGSLSNRMIFYICKTKTSNLRKKRKKDIELRLKTLWRHLPSEGIQKWMCSFFVSVFLPVHCQVGRS